MSDLMSGSYTLNGFPGFVTMATVAPAQTVALTLAGAQGSFDIVSLSQAITTITQTVSYSDDLVLSALGGEIALDSTIAANADVVSALIGSGGILVVDRVLAGQTNGSSVTFNDGGGTLVIGGPTGAVSAGLLIAGLTSNADVIDAASLSFSGITGYTISAVSGGAQLITVDDSAGDFSFMSAGTSFTPQTDLATGGPLVFSTDQSGGTDISVCFLAGTRIAVPGGETPVESLHVGDLVATSQPGGVVFKPIVWIGYRTIGEGAGAHPSPDSPVRLRADAFSSQVPRRDLLVTPDHCILVEGRLVPARMLVNGRSIISDTSIRRYQYFHIELEEHSILLAEGLQTESYLDTGNRSRFANAALSSLHADCAADCAIDTAHKAWSRHAAAPLAVDRRTVETIWRRLAGRADLLSFPQSGAASVPPQSLVTVPDLRLVTQAGFVARPVACRGRVHSFAVPPGTRSLRLVSRTASPAETIGPFVDDRRALGVLVGLIDVAVGPRQENSASHLLPGDLDGWHAVEPGDAARWTSGSAVLPLDFSRHADRWTFIDIEIVHAGPYLADAATPMATRTKLHRAA